MVQYLQMDVRSIGIGAAGVDATLRSSAGARLEPDRVASASSAGPPADTIAALLERLAVPGISDLILHLENRRSSVDPGTLSELLRVAGASALVGDISRVRSALTEIVKLNPEWIQNIQNEPKLQALRGDVNALLENLAGHARVRAERQIEDATAGLELAADRLRPAELRDAETVLALANRLYESGRHIDFVRAAELAQVLLLHFPVSVQAAPLIEPQPGRPSRPSPGLHRSYQQIAEWWKRAPILVLLGAWVALGCIAAVLSLALRAVWPEYWNPLLATGIWAAGFLAFVAYVRFRSFRL